jgi:hypothetical protein
MSARLAVPVARHVPESDPLQTVQPAGSPPVARRPVVEALVLLLQPITLAFDLASSLLRARHLFTQAGDLVLLALDQIVTLVAGRSPALGGHARVMS